MKTGLYSFLKQLQDFLFVEEPQTGCFEAMDGYSLSSESQKSKIELCF